jgi:N-methylhydantoinase A
VAGVPIALPRVLVETVSAGGGSLGWADDAGALRAGPRSAGARPGPAAFGRGGVEATVTDAHVVLGHIGQGQFQGGVQIDAAAAHRAVEALGRRVGSDDSRRVARALIAAADASMARALRRVSVERGVDPRSCVVVAFGGGGPLHACDLASQIGARRVLVPPHAGVLSAVGLALAPMRREAIGSVMRRATTLDAVALAGVRSSLGIRAGGAATDERRLWLRARYVGQGHELEVAVHEGDDGATVARRFGDLHATRVGFTLPLDVEVVSARLTSSAAGAQAHFARPSRVGAVAFAADGVPIDDGLSLEATVRGPATIALPDATLSVAGGWTARALPLGGWMVEAE